MSTITFNHLHDDDPHRYPPQVSRSNSASSASSMGSTKADALKFLSTFSASGEEHWAGRRDELQRPASNEETDRTDELNQWAQKESVDSRDSEWLHNQREDVEGLGNDGILFVQKFDSMVNQSDRETLEEMLKGGFSGFTTSEMLDNLTEFALEDCEGSGLGKETLNNLLTNNRVQLTKLRYCSARLELLDKGERSTFSDFGT